MIYLLTFALLLTGSSSNFPRLGDAIKKIICNLLLYFKPDPEL
jgi:hypothetical protein